MVNSGSPARKPTLACSDPVFRFDRESRDERAAMVCNDFTRPARHPHIFTPDNQQPRENVMRSGHRPLAMELSAGFAPHRVVHLLDRLHGYSPARLLHARNHNSRPVTQNLPGSLSVRSRNRSLILAARICLRPVSDQGFPTRTQRKGTQYDSRCSNNWNPIRHR